MLKVALINEDGDCVQIGDKVSAYYSNGWHHDGTLEEICYESGEGGEVVVSGVRIDVGLIEKVTKLTEYKSA